MKFITRASMFWQRYKKNRAAVVGLTAALFVILIALLAPFISLYPPRKTGVGEPFQSLSLKYPMGTDDLGRDVYSDCIWGARTSLLVGFLVAGTSALIGTLVGAISGYYGGIIDDILMRITDIFLIMPIFILALVIVALFGNNIWNVIFALGILSWPATARLLRAEFISLRESEFVEAARAIGLGEIKIIFGEILPNASFLVIVNASLQVANAILMEASLSFLGLGDPTQASWGNLIQNSQFYFRQAWWMAVFPGLAISLTALALNLVGDGLNDALNPRLRER